MSRTPPSPLADNSVDRDKPDRKLPGSPVSPLRARPAAAASSSSSSSSGPPARRSGSCEPERRSFSGEISASISHSPAAPRPGHRRSGSGPVLYSSTASSSPGVIPAGNICPSGKTPRAGMFTRAAARSDVLGTGTGHYGHGSVMRGGAGVVGGDSEEMKRAGNEMYRRGMFAEALRMYDRAIALAPENAAYRGNRAAALTGLRRLGEAVKECEEAVRQDPGYVRAHQRLVLLHIRLGNVENSRKHLTLVGQQQDAAELQKLNALERHLGRCADARKIGDWRNALRESDAAIAVGADSSPMIAASRAEALLRLHRLDEADGAISGAFRLETLCPSCPQTKIFGMLSSSYMYIVRAKVEMTFGRFDNAVAAAEKARQIDLGSVEVTTTLKNVRSVANARAEGNRLFNGGKFAEASLAYGEGLKLDPSNPVLYCNRAACRSKLGQWERSVDDCNEALRIQPNYTKALLRRASSSGKLERWAESVQDYEILRKELPGDSDVAEALFHAQLALKKSRGEVSSSKFAGDADEVSGLEQFQSAISSPGVHVVFFLEPRNQDCIKISPFVDTLCNKYTFVNFLKIDINEHLAIRGAESVKTVPAFTIYKNGARLKELIRPNPQTLEHARWAVARMDPVEQRLLSSLNNRLEAFE